MYRKDLEDLMKERKAKYVVVLMTEDDPQGTLCQLKGGYLCDCWGKRIDRKIDMWGFIKYTKGVPSRHKWPARYEKIKAPTK